jgi:hypothetical protein
MGADGAKSVSYEADEIIFRTYENRLYWFSRVVPRARGQEDIRFYESAMERQYMLR